MKDFIKKINSLDYVKLTIFLDEVFHKSNKAARSYLYFELKKSPRALLEKFLDRFSEVEALRFRSEIERQEEPDRFENADGEERITFILNNLADILKQAISFNEGNQEKLLQYRELIKSTESYAYADQMLGKPVPSAFKPIIARNAEIFDLPQPDDSVIKKERIFQLISERCTQRNFTSESLTISELSWLLWATQGVRKEVPAENRFYRTVPSGGDRHPFETYLAINNVEGLKPGIYRFLSHENKLLYLKSVDEMEAQLIEIGKGQSYVGNCAVCFMWSAIPQRTEWRYANHAKKNILIEAGHLGQNLYLATEAINCGTCGIAAYDQTKVDELLELDGIDEFVVYMMPVGKIMDNG
jgi:SagB-type dehydrogenase family enzyme